jgi:hypothetical protein
MSDIADIQAKIKHIIMDFQIGDLKECCAKCGANFLIAIGLMTATEFLGGVLNGKLGSKKYSRDRFETGFEYLGQRYKELLQQTRKSIRDIYANIRCGLVHQYLPSQTSGIYAGKTSDPGIIEINGQYIILHENYIRDLELAVDRLLDEVATNTTISQNANRALKRIPVLV